jgi:hypothetical protein
VATAAASLAALTALVGGYGAVYFTGVEGWTDIGITFVMAYEFLAALGLVSAVALLRGRPFGRFGVLTYAVWMVAFTCFKLIAFQETEAILFGLVGLAALVLASRPSVRDYAGGAR